MLEFDTPDVLLSDSESQFSTLVEQTGVAEAEHLRALAKTTSRSIKLNDIIFVGDPDYDFESEMHEKDPLIV